MHAYIRTSILAISVATCLGVFVTLNPPRDTTTAATPPKRVCHTHSDGHTCGETCIQTLLAQTPDPIDADKQDEIDAYLAMIDPVIAALPQNAGHCFCFAPDTDSALVHAFCQEHPELCGLQDGPRHELVTRWSGGSQGDPRVLTWSFIPDSTSGANSYLFSGMDAKFGGDRAKWISLFEDCFERWGELTGVSYVRVTNGVDDWDDGASWGVGGNGTTRGDIRIRMITYDGPSQVLAFNSYPDGGDMTLDGDESWGNASGNYIFLRNVVMHEHGHGLGMAHVCPILGGTNGRLLEPYYNSAFDGPRHDDIRAIQRGYGDVNEPDNSYSTATDIGVVAFGAPIHLGNVPSPSVPYGSLLSIDANGEEDWFKFTVNTPSEVTVTVTPIGFVYDSSPQDCSGGTADCCSGNMIDSEVIADLNIQVYRADTLSLIATSESSPAGEAETLADQPLTGSPGDFYVRIYEGNSPTDCQLYQLDISVLDTTADVTPPTPNPPEWASEPAPLSTSSITMTALAATDPSGVEYLFAGSNQAPITAWLTSNVFVHDNLLPNYPYGYTVRTRDLSPQLNLSAFSSPAAWSATAIQPPTGITFANVSDTSMDVTATGSFSNLNFGDSGLFFEMTPDEGTGANVWTSGTTSQTVSVTGLSPNTNYTFRVKARNFYGSRGEDYETAFTSTFDQSTTGGMTCSLFGDVNQDGVVDGSDIAGFTRAKLGQTASPGENPACAENGGSVDQDISDFIDALMN